MSAFTDLKNLIVKLRSDVEENAKIITRHENNINQLLEKEVGQGSDPYVLKKIAILEDSSKKMREDIDTIMNDILQIKTVVNQDKSVIETIIYQKLEQNIIKLINAKLQNPGLENA